MDTILNKIEQIKPEERYFPITTNVDRDDYNLWSILHILSQPYYGEYVPIYGRFLESVNNTIKPLDTRFAALIEIGNLARDYGEVDVFEKAGLYLKEIVSKVEPDKALIGLNNYLKSYCLKDLPNDEIYPDYYECIQNRGAILNLIKLVRGIKGGNEELKKEDTIDNFNTIILFRFFRNSRRFI